ncbi:peptidylprolyl isomerase [Actinocorallia aurea]
MSKVRLHTSLGDIVIRLDAEKAPKTVANFLGYVGDGFYDGTVFHRVIDGFMVQGGGMEPGLKPKATGAPIENEADNGLKNTAYSVAMARKSEPHSATAQFFINVTDNPALDHTSATPRGWGYAVFGEVVEGREVVDALKTVPTGSQGGHGDVPLNDVVIERAEVVE